VDESDEDGCVDKYSTIQILGSRRAQERRDSDRFLWRYEKRFHPFAVNKSYVRYKLQSFDNIAQSRSDLGFHATSRVTKCAIEISRARSETSKARALLVYAGRGRGRARKEEVIQFFPVLVA